MSDTYNATMDAFGSYSLGIAALRENGVRLGLYEPMNDDERRQSAEGSRAWSELDCVSEFRRESDAPSVPASAQRDQQLRAHEEN